jgi:hypothetical protein
MQECNKDDALLFDVALFHAKISKISRSLSDLAALEQAVLGAVRTN